jgi:transcriptional regulator with XRE-family HTH domain
MSGQDFRCDWSRLKRVRAQLNCTQEQLAAAAGRTDGCVSLIERNLREPSASTWIGFARALGVPLWDLLDVTDAKAPRQ